MNHPAFEEALASNDQAQLRLLYEVAMHQRNLAEDRVRCLLNTVRVGTRETAVTSVTSLPSKPKDKPVSTEIEF